MAENQEKKKKQDHIYQILNQSKIDLEELRKACITKYGLVNDEVRKRVWPLLLNMDMIQQDLDQTKDSITTTPSGKGSTKSKQQAAFESYKLSEETEWRKYIKGHRESGQIEKDINRSLNSFDICKQLSRYRKSLLRDQLSHIIHAILVKNQHLYYYQGFHDYVSVFMLTLGENLGYYCAEAASRYVIRDYMLETFEGGVMPALRLISKLLEQVDPDLYDIIQEAGNEPTFAVSWLLTWFSHDLQSFTQVQRIYDACLSQHPLFPVYLAAATIKYNKRKLEQCEEDPLTAVFMVFQRLEPHTFNFNVDTIIETAVSFTHQVPPEELVKLQDTIQKFKIDSPFLRYELEKYYLKNEKLLNVVDQKQKKKDMQMGSIAKTVKNFTIVLIGVGLMLTTFAINTQKEIYSA